MRKAECVLAPLLSVFAAASTASPAETGDLDGDGLLTIRDVILLYDSEKDPTITFNPGSFEAFADFPAYPKDESSATGRAFYRSAYVMTSVYTEMLRRTLGGPFPVYSFLHQPTTWLEDRTQAPLPADSRATMRLLGGHSIDRDRFAIEMELELTAPVRAFSLAVQSPGGMLRVPWLYAERWDPPLYAWLTQSWGFLLEALKGEHDRGDIMVNVAPLGYLMSGGDFVVTYGLTDSRQTLLPPGVHRFVGEGRLPKGTLAGTYPLTVLDGSQVLFADGTVARPTVTQEGALGVPEDITLGYDEGLPPLRFDVKTQRVLGAVEFRFADEGGNGVPIGKPVARGKPGENVRFRVQVRTETPLNRLSFEFSWPPGSLLCTAEDHALLEIEGDSAHTGDLGADQCTPWIGFSQMNFFLGSNWPNRTDERQHINHLERALEYFKPLGEWIDLWESVMVIPDEAPLAYIPLEFVEYDREGWETSPRAEYAPYTVNHYPNWSQPESVQRDQWEYDVRFRSSFVEVIGGANPPPLPNYGIRVQLGNATIAPGGTAEIPVLASANVPLWYLWLVVETDPESVTIDAVKTRVHVSDTAETKWVTAQRGEHVGTVDAICGGQGPCFGTPHGVGFNETPTKVAAIYWSDLGAAEPFPGDTLVEIARLVVSATESPAKASVTLKNAKSV